MNRWAAYGLGAPAGSVLAGPRDLIQASIRHRRMLGGAMRQVGMLAAACDFGLTHHYDRLAQDHEHARLIAGRLRGCPGVRIADEIPTNIVVFELEGAQPDAGALVSAARERGVLINALGAAKLRLLTHLDVTRAQCEQAAGVLVSLLEGRGKR